MYAIGGDHPYRDPCIRVLRRIEEDALRVVSSVEVLQEILHRYRSLREYEVAATAFTQFKVLCDEILPLEPGDVDRAFEILEDHREISVRDGIGTAAAAAAVLEGEVKSSDAFPRGRPSHSHRWVERSASAQLSFKQNVEP